MKLRGIFRTLSDVLNKVFKNGPSKICGRQPLKKFTWSILKYFKRWSFSTKIITDFQPMTSFLKSSSFDV